MNLSVTVRQKAFLDAGETEVLYGGAAGGGKSYGQVIDALLFALTYPGSRQLLLRRSFPELERSLIRTARALYPASVFTYRSGEHSGYFANGSILDFGYLFSEGDVYQYQSAEYDVIRFDELTHFTKFQYLYMISRIRGANGYPKQIKSSTNPGGIGHAWVKERFIDPAPFGTPFLGEDGSRRIFLPARIEDNRFLTEKDPDYRRRLESLPSEERRALLHGEWNLFTGQFFSEFRYDLHTCDPFPIPPSWRRYRTLDYGLDRLAVLWIALSPEGRAYVYRELCESNLIISAAAGRIRALTPPEEEIYVTLAPPDLFGRGQESGKSRAALFREEGVAFARSSNDRLAGWMAVKELLSEAADGLPRLQIFRTCRELCRCLPMLLSDPLRPGDVLTEPHAITHAPDALRGFAVYHTAPAHLPEAGTRRPWTPDLWQDYYAADEDERRYLIKKYGEPL
ncbi:MAG: phage terminase large subunit [Clostridia bacterium]|nr:phage terminase large subunit [Clostridia bacterium]